MGLQAAIKWEWKDWKGNLKQVMLQDNVLFKRQLEYVIHLYRIDMYSAMARTKTILFHS